MTTRGTQGRPPDNLTMKAIPEGPIATPKRKWAAIAKYHAINSERERKGFDLLKDKAFLKWTGISKEDLSSAESHKEYVDVALSIAKGRSVMWFRDELENMQKSAQRLYLAGEDKSYLQATMNLAEMLKFKEFSLEGMEETEVRNADETIEEIMIILKDEAVKAAITNEEGLVSQKIIPALVGASFKSRSKKETFTLAQPSGSAQEYSPKGPDSPVDSVLQTDPGAGESQEVHPLHRGEQDRKV